MPPKGLRLRVFWLVILAGGASLTPPALAEEQAIFGPAQYTRTSGPPNQFMEPIALPPMLTAPFRLHIQNGNPDGTGRVSSATLTVNGAQIAVPADFSQQVVAFDRPVTLQGSNTLQVRLTSLPGSFLVLTLYGSIPPPTLTSLEPPTLPITQGVSGTLTATISATQPVDTTISLQSSTPAVATVPASVHVPAGQLTGAVPVSAVEPGTAMITATLNGSSLQSTVTVRPAGPTLTSLLPVTLQVTQGASGLLTLTLSAVQATATMVSLISSDRNKVGLPPEEAVIVPAGQLSQAFAVFGVSPGQATISAYLNNTPSVESQVTVVVPLPQVVSLLPPTLPLTEGSTGTLTVTLNAAQPTDTEVFLSTSDAAIVGLSEDRVTVPARDLSASFVVTGIRCGLATVTASLAGSSATSAFTVSPPPPTLQGLTCPPTLTTGATGLCTLTLNATQLTDIPVPVASSESSIVTVPTSVAVPANSLTAQFVVTGGAVGTATLTAGPVNGTSQSVGIQVVPPPPTIVSLLPPTGTLFVGATAGFTLTLNAAQPRDTVVPLRSDPSRIISQAATATIPAGSLTATVTVAGLTPGTTILTAGPLNGTTAWASISVNQLPPILTHLVPSAASLPKGKVGTLTVTIAPTQPDTTVVLITSSDPTSVEVPASVTIPAGADTASVPILALAVGSATLTAGPLNGASQQVTVTVTPAELVALAITPPAPTIAKGQNEQFTATGTYTDGTTRDLTGEATWSSDNQTVATIISRGGRASGLREGQATITAAVGTMTATASLTVTPSILASIAITPSAPSVVLGQTLQLTALGTLTDGTNQDVTAQITWTSGDPTIATVSSTGLITPVLGGSVTITATHVDGFTATTALTVVLVSPTLTSFSPSAGPVGTTVTLTGTNLASTTRVTFNGTAAFFAILSPTQLTATVPAGATRGLITVTTPGGAVASLSSFTIFIPPTLTITSPANGATISATNVQVRGTVNGATSEIGVSVNGLPAFVNSSQWVVEVPVVVGSNSLEARATDALGGSSSVRITITVSPAASPALRLAATPESGVAPLTVTWQVLNQTGQKLVQFEFDPIGNGSFGSPGPTFDGTRTTYTTPGLFAATLRATDDKGTQYLTSTTVNTLARDQVDALLRGKWAGMKAALTAGDIEGGLLFFTSWQRPRYRTLFTGLSGQLAQIVQEMQDIQLVYLIESRAKYRLRRTQPYGGQVVTLTYYVYFIQDASGRWYIEEF